MGFREDAVAFKQKLPELEDVGIRDSDRLQAEELMSEALVLKKMLDPLEENSPARRYQEVKQALAILSMNLGISGIRYRKIAFTSFKRKTPSGTEYTVNAIEELPE